MAAASGLLSPSLVKNALRSISEEREVRCGSSIPEEREVRGGSSSPQDESDGWTPSPRLPEPQENGGYIPLAAKRVREACRRRPRQTAAAAAAVQGSARPALDSEGDSDISSEGSSGASSLPPSQLSGGAGSGRHRSSESSDGDHDHEHDHDQLAGVNLRQLKNSYTSVPTPAARGSSGSGSGSGSGAGRPRDMSKITVNMASLKSVYSSTDGPSSAVAAVAAQKAGAADLPAGLSLPSIRAAYVQQTSGGRGTTTTDGKPPSTIHTGVSIDKLRSSFGKEEPADHTRIHVRSFDSSKAISRFSKDAPDASSSVCRACGRRVFQMESVHAEGGVWHKNCFRCSQCNKPLTVDTYASHEGKLYCVVHHRQVLKAPPAAVTTVTPAAATEDVANTGPRADGGSGEMVGAVEQTVDVSATEVVKASNKADYGLDDLQHLNVKDRFSVFERTNEDEQGKAPASVEVKRSQSILDKMKKFQGRTAARDPDSPDDSENSGDEGHAPRDPDTVRSSTKKERPIGLAGLGDVKSRFEKAGAGGETDQDPAKGEAAKLRGMICGAREHKLAYEEAVREQEEQTEAARRPAEDPSLVIQGNLRESYERAVLEAESPRPSSREEAVVRHHRAADMASRFERGQLNNAEEDGEGRPAAATTDDDATQNGGPPAEESAGNSLSSDGGDSEMNRADSPDSGPAAPEQQPSADPELPHSDTTKRMLNKFKQLEQSAGHADEELSPHRERAQGNARQMLSKYRQMQEAAQKEDLPDGPRPLKSFTPPPEEPVLTTTEDTAENDAEDTTDDAAEDPDIIRASSKVPDEFLNKRTDQARSLRDKFESWAPPAERGFTVEEDCKPTLEITRNLRAKFESLKEQQKPATDKPQTHHRTSKFIMEPSQAAEMCSACGKRVYAMERLEVDKRILHKNCFRCSKCNCVLRMDTYTFNAGKLFCTPHFKQIFKTKGNYDEGFGVESRAKHWSSSASSHSDQPTSLNGSATSASPRPAGEPAATNGSASPDTNGAASPEPEQETEQQPEPEQEPAAASDSEPEQPGLEQGADVFQQVYESTVAGGL